MSWRIAESLKKLREQINAEWPKRDKASDGGIGDERHANSSSDHNPWVKDAKGHPVVTAIDIDEDLAPTINSIQFIVDAIIKSRDKRVKYIIYEGRICSSYPAQGYKAWEWRPYKGTKNPHKQHAHISVQPTQSLFDSRAEWSIGIAWSEIKQLHKDLVKEGLLEVPESAVVPAAGNPESVTENVTVEPAVDVTSSAAAPPTPPAEVAVDAPEPTGFMAKLKTQLAAVIAFVGGGAGLKEWFGVQLSPETVDLLKILLPTVLGLGFLGFLVWFVSEKVIGYKTLKLKAEYATDPERPSLRIDPK